MALQSLLFTRAPDLIVHLRGDIPRSAPLIGKLMQMQRSNKSLIDANLYVDTWPQPEIVLLENLTYRRKNEVKQDPVLVYNRGSKEKLKDIIKSDQVLVSLTTLGESEFQDNDWNCSELVRTIAQEYGINVEVQACPEIYWLRDREHLIESECPGGYRLAKLELHHADRINNTWKFSSPHTLERLKRWIQHSDNVGVFCCDTDELVGWGLVAEAGCISALHTITEHRKKGIAKAVITRLTNLLLKANMVPYTYIEENNHISQNLFQQMGFSNSEIRVAFFVLGKKE
ncbi:uncharacterized protein LOC116617041 isoform X2 [Nematostella vectensis]|uniref:uncharacterized protein LOC116617041 isoform X2 n=1 Tax=Nematostella vectensis TaxID=45351 RepID=UPI0020777ADC|nr:uncharacterized protein LOC116617041 isoform X2 [Nematostella vectensis]